MKVDEGKTIEIFVITKIINSEQVTVSNYNYLLVFQIFRDKLLTIGYGIKCSGSILNVI